MAKPQQAVAKAAGTELVTNAGLGALRRDAAKGVSRAAEDNLVPLIYVLQAQSPQVNRRNPAYIEGAEAGSIWLRDADAPIIPGDDGVLFQPCYFDHDVVEWVPRDSGGGLVARHQFEKFSTGRAETMDELVERLGAKPERRDDKNPNRIDYILPNGNELIETRYHAGFAIHGDSVMPYVIPLSGSGHSVSKRWMFKMSTIVVPVLQQEIEQARAAGEPLPVPQPLPSYACYYRLRTRLRSNASGEWFVLDPVRERMVEGLEPALEQMRQGQMPDWVPGPDYMRGLALHDAFASGEKQADAPTEMTVDRADTGVDAKEAEKHI
jgi:hypothetical protein